jgi:Ca2+-binding RTX toxin-like protein
LALNGNELANRIYGGALADTLDGGAGADTLTGGAGDDLYFVDDALDRATEAVGGGIDTVQASVTHTLGFEVDHLQLTGSSAANGTGNALANTLLGNEAANRLDGRDGADTLVGGDGSDTLTGWIGDDRLAGALGADRLIGGDGLDVFAYLALGDSGPLTAERDTIADFSTDDIIDLSAIDADVTVADDQSFAFIGTAAFSGVAGELRYAAGPHTLVTADVDGDGLADFSLMVNGPHALQATSFLL